MLTKAAFIWLKKTVIISNIINVLLLRFYILIDYKMKIISVPLIRWSHDHFQKLL